MTGYPKSGYTKELCLEDCARLSTYFCAKNDPAACAGGGHCKGIMLRKDRCWLKNTFSKVDKSEYCPENTAEDGDMWCKLYHVAGDEDKLPLPYKHTGEVQDCVGAACSKSEKNTAPSGVKDGTPL